MAALQVVLPASAAQAGRRIKAMNTRNDRPMAMPTKMAVSQRRITAMRFSSSVIRRDLSGPHSSGRSTAGGP